MRPTSWAARSATCSSGAARTTGTWPRTPSPSGSSSSSRAPSTRTGSGPSPCAATARCSRSRPSGPTTTTPTSGDRTGSSSATRSSSTWRAATSRSTPWPGARGPARRPPSSTLRRPVGRGRPAAPGGRRSVGPVRGGRAPDGPRDPPRHHARLRGRGRDAGGRRGEGDARRAPVGRADRRRARQAAGRDRALGRAPAAEPRPGVLASISPELAAQRGVPQNKVPGEDLWDHTVRSVDAAPAARPIVRLAALLHDIGKPATFADGRFMGHDAVGAELAGAFLDRLRSPRAVRRSGRRARSPAHVQLRVELVRRRRPALHREDGRDRRWGARRAARPARGGQRRVGPAGRRGPAGRAPGPGGRRASRRPRPRSGRAGDRWDRPDRRPSGSTPGPRLGRILEGLVERVIADPALNERPTLLLLARAALAEDR